MTTRERPVFMNLDKNVDNFKLVDKDDVSAALSSYTFTRLAIKPKQTLEELHNKLITFLYTGAFHTI